MSSFLSLTSRHSSSKGCDNERVRVAVQLDRHSSHVGRVAQYARGHGGNPDGLPGEMGRRSHLKSKLM